MCTRTHASAFDHDPDLPANRKGIPWLMALGAAILSGGLLAVGFRPLNWHFAAWFACVPWLIVLPKLTARQAWIFGAVLGLAFYRIGLDWLFGIHGLLAAIGICCLAIWTGLAFRVAKLLMERFGTNAMLWAVPLAFTGQEIARCEGPRVMRFAYLALGYSQADNLWVSQIASLGGVYVLTCLIMAVNASLAYAFIVRKRSAWAPCAAITLITLGLGWASQPRADGRPAEIPVACIQSEEDGFSPYIELLERTLTAHPKPAFVVMPEHTIGGDADRKHPFVDALRRMAAQYETTLCVGAHTRAKPGSPCDYDNVGLLIGPDGNIIGKQAKCVPVQFMDDGNLATSQTIFDTPQARVGIYVCYDGSFTDIPRGVVDAGAELLLVPVMNPEVWPAQQRWQQLDIAKFRSIELRRWAVRAASSGISAIVSPTGRVTAKRTQREGPGLLCGNVAACDARTLFVRGGYLFTPIVGYSFLAVVLVLTVLTWRPQKSTPAGLQIAHKKLA